MSKKKLKAKLRELEQRIVSLEARPHITYTHPSETIQFPNLPLPPYSPAGTGDPNPNLITITCVTDIDRHQTVCRSEPH